MFYAKVLLYSAKFEDGPLQVSAFCYNPLSNKLLILATIFNDRLCEICSETATNVSGVSNYEFMEKWNERRFMEDGGNSSRRFGGCSPGQPFCNFLMACLVIAFVLSWFFRVNVF